MLQMPPRKALPRSLHLLGAALEMGYPLDASVELVSRFAETRKLQSAWRAVYYRLFDGEGLSGVFEQLRDTFPPSLVSLIALGEFRGELPRALFAAAGAERFDIYTTGPMDGGITEPLQEPEMKGPLVRIADALVQHALGTECESIGVFLPAPHLLRDALRVPEAVTAAANGANGTGPPGAHGAPPQPVPVGAAASAVAFAGTGRTAAGAEVERVLKEFAPYAVRPGVSAAPAPGPQEGFDPDTLSGEDATVAVFKGDAWTPVVRMQRSLYPLLARHYLFRARVPYWLSGRLHGTLRLPLAGREHRFPLAFVADPRRWTVYFDLREEGEE